MWHYQLSGLSSVQGQSSDGAQSVSESCVINQFQLAISMPLEISSGHEDDQTQVTPKIVTEGAPASMLHVEPFTPSSSPPVHMSGHSRSICQITSLQICWEAEVCGYLCKHVRVIFHSSFFCRGAFPLSMAKLKPGPKCLTIDSHNYNRKPISAFKSCLLPLCPH